MFRQHKSGGKELRGDTAYCTVWNGIFCYYIYTVVVYMAYACTTSEYWIKGKWYILCWRWYCYSTVIYNPLLDLCIFLFHTTSTEHQYTLIYMCVYINIYIFFFMHSHCLLPHQMTYGGWIEISFEFWNPICQAQ